MSRNLGIIALTALVASGVTYQATSNALRHNRPLTLTEQLAQNELTDEHEMLLKDIVEPSFGAITLTGVAQTNHCGASEQGCLGYGTQMLTEEELSIYTGRNEHISILSYTTDQPITSEQLATLKEKIGTRPYRLIDPATPLSGTADDGVASLFSFSVIANPGETQVIVVLQSSSD